MKVYDDEEFVGDEDPLYLAERELVQLYQDSFIKALREGKPGKVRAPKKLEVYTEQAKDYNYYMNGKSVSQMTPLEEIQYFQENGSKQLVEYWATRPYWQKERW